MKKDITIYYKKGRTCYKLKEGKHSEFLEFLDIHIDEMLIRFKEYVERKIKFPIFVISDDEFYKITKCLKLKEDKVLLFYESSSMKLCGIQSDSGFRIDQNRIIQLPDEERNKIDYSFIKIFSY